MNRADAHLAAIVEQTQREHPLPTTPAQLAARDRADLERRARLMGVTPDALLTLAHARHEAARATATMAAPIIEGIRK